MSNSRPLTSRSVGRQVSLRDVVLPTQTTDPRKTPGETFTYIDVSSVKSETLSVEAPSFLNGADAPSRARKPVRTGDVLFATIRPSLRRVALIPERLDGAICSTAFTVLRANPEFSDPQYLYYNTLSDDFVDRVSHLQRGSSYPAVSDGDVLNQLVSLPPLDEQRRIARILSTIQVSGRAREHEVEALKTLRAAFKTDFLNHARRNSPTVQLSEIVGSIATGPFGSQLHASDYVDNGVPVLNPMHLLANGLSTGTRHT
jgi:type I restriction enzyme S subunit